MGEDVENQPPNSRDAVCCAYCGYAREFLGPRAVDCGRYNSVQNTTDVCDMWKEKE